MGNHETFCARNEVSPILVTLCTGEDVLKGEPSSISPGDIDEVMRRSYDAELEIDNALLESELAGIPTPRGRLAHDLASITARLHSADLERLSNTSGPPDEVLVVVLAVVMMRPLGEEDEAVGWSGARLYLRDPRFIEALTTFDPAHANRAQVTRVEQLLASPSVPTDKAGRAELPRAARTLLQWVELAVKKCRLHHGNLP
jgi:hypothetical protein